MRSQTKATAKDPAFNLRMPQRVLDYIDKKADESGRSRNSEIVFRLRQSMMSDERAA